MALDIKEYVVGTFESCDVEERVEDAVLAYIEENDLMDVIVLSAVGMMRDWYDDASGDAAHTMLRAALMRHVGWEKLKELEA